VTRRVVLVIQHEQCEGLGSIAEALAASGVEARYVRAFAGDEIPRTPGPAVGLVVMGGPMGVYHHPRLTYLADEMRLIEAALGAGRPILGICLGSQLVAQVLGADVRPSGLKEIGWYPVSAAAAAATDPLWQGVPPRFPAFHWHGDAFPLPPGTVHLAGTEQCRFQAFRRGTNVYGIQFHLEVTDGIVREMVRAWPEELAEEGLDGARIVADTPRFLPEMRRVADQVFGGWAGLLEHGDERRETRDA
jgi:GMP synthase (glutamine-hydrolysing)